MIVEAGEQEAAYIYEFTHSERKFVLKFFACGDPKWRDKNGRNIDISLGKGVTAVVVTASWQGYVVIVPQYATSDRKPFLERATHTFYLA